TNHANDKEDKEVGGCLQENVTESAVIEDKTRGEEGQSESRVKPVARIPARMLETENEGEEIDAQRQDPEQRDNGDVLTHLICGCKKDHGSACREREPKETAPGVGGRCNRAGLKRLGIARRSARFGRV